MNGMRLIYRLIVFLSVVVLFVLAAGGERLCSSTSRRKRASLRLSSFTSCLVRFCLRRFGFKISLKDPRSLLKGGNNYMIVANHIGYLDIPILQAVLCHNVFLTHNEVREKHPFLVFFPKRLGAYFIERRSTKNLRTEIRNIAELLKKGFHFVFFPEGTSSKGGELLPFHAPFFLSAIQAGKPVLPLCIRYPLVNNRAFGETNKHFVCWSRKKESFGKHFFRLLAEVKTLHIHIEVLNPVPVGEGHRAGRLATQAHESLTRALKNPL